MRPTKGKMLVSCKTIMTLYPLSTAYETAKSQHLNLSTSNPKAPDSDPEHETIILQQQKAAFGLNTTALELCGVIVSLYYARLDYVCRPHLEFQKMELPEDLLIEILILLPAKSILRFKCVCKHWFSVIQTPQFVERQCRISNTRRTKLLCFRNDLITDTQVISVLDRQTLEKLEDLEWPPFHEEEGVEGAENSIRRIKIFGPVNGIYCMYRSLIDKWVGNLTLWNPATREYKHVYPEVSFPFPMDGFSYEYCSIMHIYEQQEPVSLNIGFGFDHTTSDYKIVVICLWADARTGLQERWHLRVYSLASNTWKTVYYLDSCYSTHPAFDDLTPYFPEMIPEPTREISNCFLNGVFHWACYPLTGQLDYCILAFDMTKDDMQLIIGPPISKGVPLFWTVWAFKEKIAAVSYDVYHSGDVEIWMMMEYGVEKSWAFQFEIQGQVLSWVPVGIPYDDRIFFEDDNGQLVSASVQDDDHQVEEHGVYGMKDITYQHTCGSFMILTYDENLKTVQPINATSY